MAMLGNIGRSDREPGRRSRLRRLRLPRCRHRYTWVVSFAERPAATEAVHYVKYQQCRRCGDYLQRMA